MQKIILAVHGGAGDIDARTQKETQVAERYRVMREILQSAYAAYQAGRQALDLVEDMVQALEDYSGFNAGRGSVLTREGTVEMDAALMDGRDCRAGAVATVTRVKNPICAARAVMEHSEHVLLTGTGAETFCAQQGLALTDNAYFITDERHRQWERLQESGAFETCIDTHALGTVGAIARDTQGNLAAATSTGGRLNKLPGRVGDTPMIGAGTWADNHTCAVSATGHGEIFIRSAFAHEIASCLRYRGMSLQEACQHALDRVKHLGGRGGLIAMDNQGNGALMFNTNAMYRAYVTETGMVAAGLYADLDIA